MAKKRTGPAKKEPVQCGKVITPNDKLTPTPELWIVLAWLAGDWMVERIAWDYDELQRIVAGTVENGQSYIVHYVPAVKP